MSEINEVNNRLKYCPEFDLTVCNKVPVHTNISVLRFLQEISKEII